MSADARAEALSALLDEVWDPRGLYAGPAAGRPAPGAYADCVPDLLELLDRDAGAGQVAWMLRDLAHTRMSLRPSGREDEVAAMLKRWHALWAA